MPRRMRRTATGAAGRRRAALVPVALALALGSVSACSDDTSGPEAGVSVDDLTSTDRNEIGLDEGDVQEFEQYLGQVVTVSGDLSRFLAPGAFTIGQPGTGAEPLLVLAPRDLAVELGDTLQVTGEVRSFVFDELDDVDAEAMLEAGEAQYLAFDGEPYIDATEVRVLP